MGWRYHKCITISAMVRLQTKSRNFLPWIRRHKFLSLFCVIVLLVIGVFVYEKVALELNRLAFKSAQHAIDTVYADIAAKVGQPDDYKVSNDCSRSNVEFGQGPLSCYVGTSFIYGVVDQSEATSQFKTIQVLVGLHKDLFKPTKNLSSAITSTLVVDSYYYSAQDFYSVKNLDCTIKYIYDTPREIDLAIKDTSKKPFQVNVDCYGPARDGFYPLAY